MSVKTLSKIRIIKKDASSIVAYTSKIENLCKWTKFFKKLNKKQGNTGFFETPLGEIQTKIFTENSKDTTQVIISSNIRGKNEKAKLYISSETGHSKVIFQVPLPKDATEKFVKNQKIILENELKALAVLVKTNHE